MSSFPVVDDDDDNVNALGVATNAINSGYSPSSSDFQRSLSDPAFFNDPSLSSLSSRNPYFNFIDNDTTYFCITEKYSYNFDFPGNSIQTGYVEIDNNKIVLMFPELQESQMHFQKFAHTQSVQLIINRQVMFSYEWLPIYSIKDFYRVKDMLTKAFHEYSNKTQRNHFIAQKVMYNQMKQFSLLSTMCDTNKFYLSCIEDEYSSTISLDLKSSLFQLPNDRTQEPVNVEIYIGPTLMFCTSRDLQYLDKPLQHFVTQFILHKLIKP
jgi:hypothetical protein